MPDSPSKRYPVLSGNAYERVMWVEDQLRLLRPRPAMEREARAKFGIGPRRLRAYITFVRRRWRAAADANISERRDQIRVNLEELYGLALQQKNLARALQAVRELVHLDGLAEPEKLNITHGGKMGMKLEDLDPVELARQAELVGAMAGVLRSVGEVAEADQTAASTEPAPEKPAE